MTERNTNALTKLTGLWENTSAKGTQYLTGRLGASKIVVLPNRDWTEGSKEPTHFAFLQELEQRSQQPNGNSQGNQSQRYGARPTDRQKQAAYNAQRPI